MAVQHLYQVDNSFRIAPGRYCDEAHPIAHGDASTDGTHVPVWQRVRFDPYKSTACAGARRLNVERLQ